MLRFAAIIVCIYMACVLKILIIQNLWTLAIRQQPINEYMGEKQILSKTHILNSENKVWKKDFK